MILRSITSLFLSSIVYSASANNELFTPQRFSREKLVSSTYNQELLDILSSDGIVSITDIRGFKDMKKNVMIHLHSCLKDSPPGETIQENQYNDGTVRRTMASVTIPGPGGARPFDYNKATSSCHDFSQDLASFRKLVDLVTDEFADRLTYEMGGSLEAPLMNTKDGEYSFDTFKDVVRNGEHLEHFHSYQKLNSRSELDHMKDTIELHTDQGLFIAFTPGLMVAHDQTSGKPDTNIPPVESEGFYIETPEGNIVMVDLTEQDDLVFMMGDGVNQYINPKLQSNNFSVPKKLRATPHSVSLVPHDENLARVWFGLMVLPPISGYDDKAGETYGEIRRQLTSLKKGDIPQGLGCSSTEMRVLEAGDECAEEGGLLCWHRCMSLELHGVSHDTCTTDNHAIKCVNPRDQVSTGAEHGDYYPACTDSISPPTPYPKLENYPQNEDICTNERWSNFNVADEYEFTFNLTTEKTDAFFHWTPNVEAGTVKGRLTFNGLFGWLSVGFGNLDPEARHKGMNGGHVIMATPGSPFTYSPATGLDLATDTMVAEYKINEEGSSFRHWNQPVGETSAEVIVDECFTALEFDLSKIYETSFNLEGSDYMIWGGNTEDYFVGFHSRNHRGRFTIDWTTGKGFFGKEEVIEDLNNNYTETNGDGDHDHDEHDLHETSESGASAFNSKILSAILTVLVAITAL